MGLKNEVVVFRGIVHKRVYMYFAYLFSPGIRILLYVFANNSQGGIMLSSRPSSHPSVFPLSVRSLTPTVFYVTLSPYLVEGVQCNFP